MKSARLPCDSEKASLVRQNQRIGDIEVLRGVAVLFVVIEHCRKNLFAWDSVSLDRIYGHFQFWSGVDIFFAISGFVIARSLLPSLSRAASVSEFLRVSVAFWIRRAWRLLPSAWLWLVLIQIASIAFNSSGAFGGARANFGALLAGMLNIANFRSMGTFGRHEYGASFSYWSLSLEEQFYLLLPPIAFLLGRRLPILLLLVVGAFWTLPPIPALLLNPLRADGLCLGVLLAVWSNHPSYHRFEPVLLRWTAARYAVALAVLAAIAAISARETGGLGVVRFRLVAVLSAALVFLGSYDKGHIAPEGLAKRLLLWVGSRSYALYLIHIPAFCITREIWRRVEPLGTSVDGSYATRYAVTAAVVLVGLSEINYRLVERPLRGHGARIAERFLSRKSTTPEDEPKHRSSNLPWILAGALGTIGIAAAGVSGRLDALLEPPVGLEQEITAFPTFERVARAGWGQHEAWGAWSTAEAALLDVPIAFPSDRHPKLFVKGMLLLSDRRPTATATISVNDVELGVLTATPEKPTVETMLDLPPQVFAVEPSRVRIRIQIDQLATPKDLGLSADARKLGFGLVSMRFSAAANSQSPNE